MSHGLRWPSELDVQKTTARISPCSAPVLPVTTSLASGPHCAAGGTPNWTGCAIPKAAGKYGNERCNGYASKREAKRASDLRLMQEAGQIRNLREQVEFVLIPKQDGERPCTYVADFVYDEFVCDRHTARELTFSSWMPVVEDCKGMRTDVYRIKRKLMQLVHGVKIRET